MKTIYTSEIHKYEIENNMVSFYELMGGRWVRLGAPELWDDEEIAELED